jgi:outer membrane protein OmpA-like peptidoglycan-associated protein
VLPHLGPSAGLNIHFVDDPVQLSTGGGAEEEIRARIVDDQLRAELTGGLGLFEFADIGVVVPLVLYQSGEGAPTSAGAIGSFEGTTLGDIRIVPKARLWDPMKMNGFGVGFALPLYLPTGDDESFNSDGEFRVEPRVIADWRNRAGFSAALNLAYQLRGEQQVLNYTRDDMFRWSVGGEVPVLEDWLFGVGSVFGSVSVAEGRDPANLAQAASNAQGHPTEFAVAGKALLPFDLVAQLGTGAGLTAGIGAPDVRLFASLGYSPRDSDADGDGISDELDACPAIPEDYDEWEDDDGCLDEDNDQDKILDGDDSCPNEPEDFDQFEDDNGCPDPDNDGDQVLDTADACPLEAEDRDQFEDGDGCPDPDNDGDGVLDANDKCPSEPETVNQHEDEDGCPDEKPRVKVTTEKIELAEKVYFDTNKATIQQRSFALLDEVASVLKTYSQITKVRVEGHTDSRGRDRYNMDLSSRRAKAVAEYLKSKGVDASRLDSKGFGETKPIATNDTEEGREANRRVEIRITEVNGKPAGDGPVTIEKSGGQP